MLTLLRLWISALEKKCPVCLGLLDEEDEAIELPKCSHRFHSSCILPWLQRVRCCTENKFRFILWSIFTATLLFITQGQLCNMGS
jgi:hypothetical protein